MKSTIYALSLLSLSIALSGCLATGKWTRANTTEQEWLSDKLACQAQAAQIYAPSVARTSSYTTPSSTNCYSIGSSISCNTTPGITVGGYAYDANAGARNNAIGECLRSKGYSYVQQ